MRECLNPFLSQIAKHFSNIQSERSSFSISVDREELMMMLLNDDFFYERNILMILFDTRRVETR